MADEPEKDIPARPSETGIEKPAEPDTSDKASIKAVQETQQVQQQMSDPRNWTDSTKKEQTSLNRVKESDPTNPDNPYAGKLNAAHQCPLSSARQKDLAAAIGRTGDSKSGDLPSLLPDKKAPSDKSADKGAASGDRGGDKPVARPQDAGDRTYSAGERKAMQDYTQTLQRAGETPEKAAALAKQTMDRMQDAKDKLEGPPPRTPEHQLQRLNQASKDILDRTGCKGDRRADGQSDSLSAQNRKDMVRDIAHRAADPAKFANQGDHMTCALQSMHKQKLETDPAGEALRMRNIVNDGKTTVTERNGTTRTVSVDSRSYAPDSESARPFSTAVHGDGGARGQGGHVSDALYGQMAADLLAERQGQPKGTYTYMAAHSDQFGGKNSQTATGEGLFRNNANGSKTLMENNPGVGLWEVSHLNRAMGGHDGAVFAHRDLASKTPPLGFPRDLKVTTFSSANDFKQELASYQARTGQSAQVGVNAPFLRGGGKDGHGMHAMNASLDKNGNVNFDNNWGDRGDQNGKKMTDGEIMDATNPAHWNPIGGGGGPIPTDRTHFVPGSGSNSDQPSKLDDKGNRNKDDKKDKRPEEEKKPEKRPDENNEQKKGETLQKLLKTMAEQARHAQALADWQTRRSQALKLGQQFNESEPQKSQLF